MTNHIITTITLTKDSHEELKKWCADRGLKVCTLLKLLVEKETKIKMFRNVTPTLTPIE